MLWKEKEILASINQKKLIGYKYIYDKYFASLCSFCARFSIQNTDAEDIVQDVILRLWKSDSKFNSFRALTSYLYCSIKNASLNALRKSSKMPVADISKESFQSLKTNDKSIQDVLIKEEYYRQIHIAINSLTPERKKVILATMEGLSNKEIAQRAGVSINTIKTLKIKAYRILRQELETSVFLLCIYLLHRPPITLVICNNW